MKLNKINKRFLALLCTGVLAVGSLAGCGSSGENSSSNGSAAANAGSFDKTSSISALTREDGSGTRGAFIELFGVEQTNAAGEKEDMTTADAAITNNTEVMMSSVAGNEYAIGYASLGSLNDTIKAVQIDGVDATAANVSSGTYKIARPFNIATKEGLSEVAQDFINYIMSDDGQKIVEDNGYIAASSTGAFTGANPSGKVVVAGSSSVSPVMEKLKEAYLAVNTNAQIEIQTSDSTTGMTSVSEGTCDIGMASRELKDSETSVGLTAQAIAMDGIAVIVNKDCPVTNLTTEQVKQIYTGEITTWDTIAQ